VGSHTYADEAAGVSFSVTINDDGGASTNLATAVTITDAPLTNLAVVPPKATAGSPLGSVTVATFTDTNPAGVASDFTAVVSWGDGSVSSLTAAGGGIVANANGSFAVVAGHTYAGPTAGLTFSVTVHDAGGASASTATTLSVASVPSSGSSPAPTTPTPAKPSQPHQPALLSQQFLDLVFVAEFGPGSAVLAPLAFAFASAHRQAPQQANQLAFDEFALGLEMALALSHPADAVFLTRSAMSLNTSIIDNPLYATPAGFDLGLWSEAAAIAMLSKASPK
jgi:hypothetical protein